MNWFLKESSVIQKVTIFQIKKKNLFDLADFKKSIVCNYNYSANYNLQVDFEFNSVIQSVGPEVYTPLKSSKFELEPCSINLWRVRRISVFW